MHTEWIFTHRARGARVQRAQFLQLKIMIVCTRMLRGRLKCFEFARMAAFNGELAHQSLPVLGHHRRFLPFIPKRFSLLRTRELECLAETHKWLFDSAKHFAAKVCLSRMLAGSFNVMFVHLAESWLMSESSCK